MGGLALGGVARHGEIAFTVDDGPDRNGQGTDDVLLAVAAGAEPVVAHLAPLRGQLQIAVSACGNQRLASTGGADRQRSWQWQPHVMAIGHFSGRLNGHRTWRRLPAPPRRLPLQAR